jgi:hypothetical protein
MTVAHDRPVAIITILTITGAELALFIRSPIGTLSEPGLNCEIRACADDDARQRAAAAVRLICGARSAAGKPSLILENSHGRHGATPPVSNGARGPSVPGVGSQGRHGGERDRAAIAQRARATQGAGLNRTLGSSSSGAAGALPPTVFRCVRWTEERV